jgi:hypothetical protein
VDTAAVRVQLDDLFERLPDAGPAEAAVLARLDEIMNNAQLPLSLRASAAAYASQGYFGGGDTERACARIRQAMAWMPSTSSYEMMSSMYGCQ